MMERYPIVNSGEIKGYIRTFPDFLELIIGPVGRLLSLSPRGAHKLKASPAEIRAWYEPSFNIPGYTCPSVEDYLDLLYRSLKGKLEGKVLVDMSGGKDSTASAILLSKLAEKLPISLVGVHIHMPYLEPEANIDSAEKIAEKLGIRLIVTEPPRSKMRYYLERLGLPSRGRRWCTYLKTRALREVKKRVKAKYEAKGDRIAEAGKRLRKLHFMLKNRLFTQGTVINVVYPLSLLDIVRLVRSEKLIHELYVAGMPRVSCTYCPYKSLYELYAEPTRGLDTAYIEHVLNRQYHKYYSPIARWEEFQKYHLWRFDPSASKLLHAILSASASQPLKVKFQEIAETMKSIWTEKLPKNYFMCNINCIEKLVEEKIKTWEYVKVKKDN